MEHNKALFAGIDSPMQAYAILSHLENGDLVLAIAAASPTRTSTFEQFDREFVSAFFLGLLMGMARK